MARRHAQGLPSFGHSSGERNRRHARGLPHGTQAEHHNATQHHLAAPQTNVSSLQTERTSGLEAQQETRSLQARLPHTQTPRNRASPTEQHASKKRHWHLTNHTSTPFHCSLRYHGACRWRRLWHRQRSIHCMGPYTRYLGPHNPAQVACPPFAAHATRHEEAPYRRRVCKSFGGWRTGPRLVASATVETRTSCSGASVFRARTEHCRTEPCFARRSFVHKHE